MPLLRSYSFTPETDLRTYLIFNDMWENPLKHYDCTQEVLNAVGQGKIRLDMDEVDKAVQRNELKKIFNLEAYNNRVNENRNKDSHKKSKRNLYISDINEDGKVDSYGVPETTISQCASQIDEYEKLADMDEFRYALTEYIRLHGATLVECKLDCIHALHQAFRGIPMCVKSLRRMAEEFPHMGECLHILLSSEVDLEGILKDLDSIVMGPYRRLPTGGEELERLVDKLIARVS